MYSRCALVLLSFLCFCGKVTAYTYDYSDNCHRAYQCYMSLDVPGARVHLFDELKANPGNLMATYVGDYEDCLTLLINCSREEYDQRKDHLEERLTLLEKGDAASPWFRLCKAGVYLHWAFVELRFGENLKAAGHFRKSYALIKENKRLFPDFGYNDVYYGLEQGAVSTIPDSYKWIASIFGLKGSVKTGTTVLKTFLSNHNEKQPLYSEALVFHTYMQFYFLWQQKEVWNMLNTNQFPTAGNLLNTLIKTNIAINYRKADVAIATLQAAQNNKNYSQYPVFDYSMGIAFFSRADGSCIPYFQRYLKNNRSKIFVKDAWMKLALTWYIDGNNTEATACRNHAKNDGSAQLDADKQAARFAESDSWPNKELLQARLLIDGGYYAKALEKLQQILPGALVNPADKVEYYFRLGRVYDETKDESKAFENYKTAINMGRNRKEHFAARAALQMGYLYENDGNTKEALKMYHECLDMPAHDFQNSIDQQAKSGISRLTK